jgi:polar amino acid transport system substrate-binding protein
MKHGLNLRWRHLAAGLLLGWCWGLTHAQTIQVVTEATPYTYVSQGRVAGPATEIVETALQRAGLTDHRFHLYPWARAYDLALKEPNVLIYLIARTPARESQFKWAGEFMKMEYHLYKLSDRTDIDVATLDDARRYTVGVIRDDLRHQYLQSRQFQKLVVSAHNIDNFRKLLNRQIHLIPLPEVDAADLCRETRFDCTRLQRVLTLDELTTGLYMAYSHSTPDAVVERTRAAFETLKAQGEVRKVMGNR